MVRKKIADVSGDVTDSRRSAALAEKLGSAIEQGRLRSGGFLPSERELARVHGVSGRTVRRALKLLAAKAMVAPENRRGYRVLSRANDPDRGCPLAFVVSSAPGVGHPNLYHSMLAALQDAAGRRKWSLLGVQREGRSVGEIIDHLRAARTCGAVVDSADPELLEAIGGLGIPAVMANAWFPGISFDAVVQDGFTGGFAAAEWLLRRGHRRPAFLGLATAGADMLVLERYAGVLAALARAGLALDPALTVQVPQGDRAAALAAARELLSRPNRPTAVLALWQGLGVELARAARELGLVIGRDLDMVGWSVTEGPAAEVLDEFAGLGSPAAVVWSPAELAELCIVRLMQRRADPRLPFSLTRIPVRLRASGGDDVAMLGKG